MTSVVTEPREAPQAVTRRPASGIAIDPLQLEILRDLVPLSRAEFAGKTGELLFDRDRFARILAGQLQPDARTARALWLALDTDPAEIIRWLPALPPASVPRWLRANGDSWVLDLTAVQQWMAVRDWDNEDLATAVSRSWFSRDSVNKIERGERRPKAGTLRAFCQILGCKAADLMPDSSRQYLPGWQGATSIRRAMLDFNKGMRAYADQRGISYHVNGRIKYPDKLREEYAEWLAGQDEEEQEHG